MPKLDLGSVALAMQRNTHGKDGHSSRPLLRWGHEVIGVIDRMLGKLVEISFGECGILLETGSRKLVGHVGYSDVFSLAPQ